MTRFINSPSTDIYFHLAAEEYLLKQGTEDVFMLWQDTPSVVMGKHQRVQAEVDCEWAQRQEICIARRFSGGGTVYHDLGNVNLTFIESSPRLPDFSTFVCRTLGFLSSMGLQAEADERMGLYVEGLKISGSAQCVHKNRALYHCTLLYDTDLGALSRATTPSKIPSESSREKAAHPQAAVYGVPSVRSEVTNIRTCLSALQPPEYAGYLDAHSVCCFKETAFRYFSKGEAADWFTGEELTAIYQLRNEKYSQQDWILNR